MSSNDHRTPGEHCKRCDRSVVVGFRVDDDVWGRVVGDVFNVICVLCFDEMAHEKCVPYEFKALWPCPWSVWETEVAA